ncbi:efflux RND transporter periplasmic adaptor subunit [Synechococcus sp. BSF8S]|uniref:efflux RND transporter periplasmic adaptor subunit n=1 Tax=Synechococcales TaxID=1890424 RepID=UPI0016255E09|nr:MULTISPECIES: efflux RND transporter periplasmic adaptor subunit [unclassified Synechococcus]MBC1262534.1 efflux RND transporter periplasmic adaptor subunit [Synechococcus sp. BSF8S]MBC1265424.1 efflux RND transporter periplasmic adaptor subunit [Synechococcus sp. BSA11S]
MNPSLRRITEPLRQPRVLLSLAIAGSLLLGVGLGRHGGGPAAPPAGSAADVAEPAGTIALSEEELRRSGLSIVRPEVSTGTERPISGFVEAAVGARSNVGMPVAGRVVRLLVAPGTTVRADEPIAEVQSADAAVVRADAEAAQATAQSLAYQYRLALPMARQGALSAQELESRRIASVTAGAAAQGATAKAAAIGRPDGMGRLLIRSPISGQVAAVKTSPGAVLQAGDEVAQISDARGRELRFLVSPVLAANLANGQLLRVKAGARDLRARVVAVAPDSGSGSRVTVVRAQTVDEPMPPTGTAVTAFIQVPSSQQRYSVPADAVQLVNGSAVVFGYQRGTVQAVPVVVGQQSANRAEILQGVRSGDQLLSGNTAKLRDALAGPQRSGQN